MGAAPATPWGRLVFTGGMRHKYIAGTLFYLFNIHEIEPNLFNRALASRELIWISKILHSWGKDNMFDVKSRFAMSEDVGLVIFLNVGNLVSREAWAVLQHCIWSVKRSTRLFTWVAHSLC